MKYKVGDKVRMKSLDWYSINKNEDGCVENGHSICFFIPTMKCMCGKILTIKEIREAYYGQYYTVEEFTFLIDDFMIEDETCEKTTGLESEETEIANPQSNCEKAPKYTIGDKVVLNNIKWFCRHCDADGYFRSDTNPVYYSKMLHLCGKEVTILRVVGNSHYIIAESLFPISDEMILGKAKDIIGKNLQKDLDIDKIFATFGENLTNLINKTKDEIQGR